jgi:hypothetical protein
MGNSREDASIKILNENDYWKGKLRQSQDVC